MVKCLPASGRPRFDPQVGKIPWRRKWQPTPVLLPGKFHGQRTLVGYSLWGCKELDTTEQFHFLVGVRMESRQISGSGCGQVEGSERRRCGQFAGTFKGHQAMRRSRLLLQHDSGRTTVILGLH